VAIKEKLKIKISGRIMELRYLPSYGYGKKGEGQFFGGILGGNRGSWIFCLSSPLTLRYILERGE